MVSYPWYLLAAGIFFVIIGALFGGLGKPSGSGRRVIDPKMRDDEIVRNLRSGQRVSLSDIAIFVGLLCIVASIGWRLVLWIAALIQAGSTS